MGDCENLREMIGNSPLLIVPPTVAIINKYGDIILSRYFEKLNGGRVI